MRNSEVMTLKLMPMRRRGDLTSLDAEKLLTGGMTAWDIETSGLNYRSADIGTVQIANEHGEAWIVQIQEGVRPTRIVRILEDQSVKKVFHFAPFDLGFMRYHWEVRAANVACTKILDRLVAPERSHSLRDIVQRELGVSLSKDPHIRVSDWAVENLSQDQVAYAIGDVQHLLRLYEILLERTRQKKLEGVAQRSFAYLPTRVETELMGIDDLFAY